MSTFKEPKLHRQYNNVTILNYTKGAYKAKEKLIPQGFHFVPCVAFYMLQANSRSICKHSGATTTLFWLTECDRLEPQLPDAKQCDRPRDDTVCTLIVLLLFQQVQGTYCS